MNFHISRVEHLTQIDSIPLDFSHSDRLKVWSSFCKPIYAEGIHLRRIDDLNKALYQ